MTREWLNDKIIKAEMHLLKTAFPHTLYIWISRPNLQVTNTFNIQKSTEFIQCLNVAGVHWDHNSNSRLYSWNYKGLRQLEYKID